MTTSNGLNSSLKLQAEQRLLCNLKFPASPRLLSLDITGMSCLRGNVQSTATFDHAAKLAAYKLGNNWGLEGCWSVLKC